MMTLLSPASGPPVTDWAVPRGPDDDPEFLAELDRVIRRGPEAGAGGVTGPDGALGIRRARTGRRVRGNGQFRPA